MKNIKSLNLTNYFLLTLALAILMLPQAVFALGQMSEPIVVDNAIRGEKIQQEMIVVNSDAIDVPAELVAGGAISDWTTFYMPDNLNEAITNIVIPAKESLRLIVVFSVPADAAGKDYEGTIGVINMPPSDENSDNSLTYVRQKIDRKVTITVSDSDELINIEKTSVIPNSYDLKINEPLSIRVIYDNQGNVSLKPQLRLTIVKDEKNVYDIIYPYPESDAPVSSLSQHEISPIVVQTTGWDEGLYLAKLAFLNNNETILEKNFRFSIAAGTSENKNGPASFIGSIDIRLLLLVLAVLLIVLGFVIKKFIVKK